MRGTNGSTKVAQKHVVVENIGGITRFEFPLKLGVTELVGENGQGKSSSLNAAARLFGAEIPLEPRDGEEEGSVEETTSGVKLIVRQATRRSGAADIAIADVGPLAELIDPGISDPKARNAARIPRCSRSAGSRSPRRRSPSSPATTRSRASRCTPAAVS